MNDNQLSISGNVVDEPRQKRFDSGRVVTDFRVASTRRRFDRASQQWVDSDTLFMRVKCWGELSENVSASVHKGDPVLLTGRLQSRVYETDEGPRTSYELTVTALGHDLARGTGAFRRTVRGPATLDGGVEELPEPTEDDLDDESAGFGHATRGERQPVSA